MSAPSSDIRNRGQNFAPKLETKVAEEIAHPDNPYLVSQVRLHGYEHFELMERLPFTDVLFLLLRGEVPTPDQAEQFRRLAIALINPGLRHPAGQAAIVAGVGKTDIEQLLPIALTVYGGKEDGAGAVEASMHFFQRAMEKSLIELLAEDPASGFPGFGSLYGDVDPYAVRLLASFAAPPESAVDKARQLHAELAESGIGILRAGVCAAVLTDLGFQPRQGTGLMQLLAGPGLLAHGLEFFGKPLTHMLFEPDSHYDIEGPA